MLKALRRSAAARRASEALAHAVFARARAPEFFRDLAVPDTFNGRFDMVALHGWLVLDRLEAEEARAVPQALVNLLFQGFEDALRDQGAGDIGMTRRIKKIAGAFYGRLAAYRAAEARGDLAEALLRNVYGEAPGCTGVADRLAGYALGARARLAGLAVAEGAIDFGPIEEERSEP